ncbi:hypothetical protein PPYR_01627 [Photinus pyralis]|uniref:Ubiquinone biosynthesis O-methyltransferase, mitochondrial n=1 Tax=Photinus pyralis TaxID=7054 RepID=A0A1Y1LLB4_PHOPY|nr:ubiquinone biosynthesis O-methyltransferase, mitochondrial-like [Photinus pyralis]KAB0804657.1 hypothetical protein PPYR_01627 [Photinus pyralis]
MAASLSPKMGFLQLKRISYLVQYCRISNVTASIVAQDFESFTKQGDVLWNVDGPAKPLHRMTPLRTQFIMEGLMATQSSATATPLTEKLVLDVGCGGGILTEALARRGLKIDGVDANYDHISTARSHARLDNSLTNLNYHCTTMEMHGTKNCEKYDAVVVSEVIEHVIPQHQFLDACIRCLKPGGSLFITTLNKTFMSWLVCVMLTQEIFNVIPRNTHTWNNFITPNEITEFLKKYKCEVQTVKGLYFEFLTKNWFWASSDSYWYALHAIKE